LYCIRLFSSFLYIVICLLAIFSHYPYALCSCFFNLKFKWLEKIGSTHLVVYVSVFICWVLPLHCDWLAMFIHVGSLFSVLSLPILFTPIVLNIWPLSKLPRVSPYRIMSHQASGNTNYPCISFVNLTGNL
jgi:hypothetical protein